MTKDRISYLKKRSLEDEARKRVKDSLNQNVYPEHVDLMSAPRIVISPLEWLLEKMLAKLIPAWEKKIWPKRD